MDADLGQDSNVACNVAPLTSTERSRNRRERLRAERTGGVPGKPFQPGHRLSVRHGAFSEALTGDRARQIAEAFVRSAACPPDAGEDPTLIAAIGAWAQAEAECERLRDYRDVIEAQLGDDAVPELLTEETATERSETRPAMGAMQGRDLTRQRESLARALYRAESKARTMRNDVWKRLAVHGQGRRAVSLALLMAEDDAAEQAGLDSTG